MLGGVAGKPLWACLLLCVVGVVIEGGMLGLKALGGLVVGGEVWSIPRGEMGTGETERRERGELGVGLR